MGLIVLIFAVLGVYYNRRDRFVQAMLIVAGLSLFVSFGRNFSPVYDLMYYYFPEFNKFRIPSMILILLQLIVPIFAGYGLQSIIDKGKEKFSPEEEKKYKYIIGGAGVLFIIGLVGRGLFEDLYRSFVGSDGLSKLLSELVGRQQENVLAQVRPMVFDFLYDSVVSDYLIGTFLVAAVFGLAYAYRKHFIKSSTLSLSIIVLAVADLWRVDYKPMQLHDATQQAAEFVTPDYVQAIQQDKSLYRVLDTENLREPSNTLAYYRLQSIGGYHGAKIRVYQDVVDVATIGNPTVWELMNTKYIIADPKENIPGLPVVFRGQDKKVLAYPPGSQRAWFVDSIAVDSGLGILYRIRDMSFDPHHIAFFEKNPAIAIEPPDTTAKVAVNNFGIHNVSFDVEASGNNLLFVSEIYYPKGWRAFIDGEETEIFKTDYAFRSVVVPKGKHRVEFIFHPEKYFIGRTISLVTNILSWCAMLAVGFFWWRKRNSSRRTCGEEVISLEWRQPRREPSRLLTGLSKIFP